MNITLRINGEDQKFVAPFVPALVWRKFLEYRSKMDFADLTANDLDKLVELVVITFENQFTVDDFYYGLPSDQLMDTIFKFVVNGGKDEGNEQPEKK